MARARLSFDKLFVVYVYENIALKFKRICLGMGLAILKLRPESALVNLLIGDLQYELGHKEAALKHWRYSFRESAMPLENHRLNRKILGIYVDHFKKLDDQQELFRLAYLLLYGRFAFNRIEIKAFYHTLFNQDVPEFTDTMRELTLFITPKIKILNLKTVEEDANKVTPVFDPMQMQFKDPKVFESKKELPNREVTIPEQKVFELNDCEILNSFQVTKGDDYVLYEPAGHPKYGIVSGTWLNFNLIPTPEKNKIFYLSNQRHYKNIDEGILFSGRATENYFHWLVEYVPRLLNIIEAKVPLTTPLLVREHMPKQFFELLALVNPGYPLVKLDVNKFFYRVKKLWVSTFHTHLADDYSLAFWHGGGFSKKHMLWMRSQIFQKLGLPTDEAAPKPTRMFYLARRTFRNIKNNKKIEAYVAEKGFEVIHPDTFSFAEQVKLFSEARVVAGPTGAGMGNVMFMRPGTKVLALISERNVEYAIKSNLIQMVGGDFEYIAGYNLKPRSYFDTEDEYAHSDFAIDFKQFKRAVEKTLAEIRSEK